MDEKEACRGPVKACQLAVTVAMPSLVVVIFSLDFAEAGEGNQRASRIEAE